MHLRTSLELAVAEALLVAVPEALGVPVCEPEALTLEVCAEHEGTGEGRVKEG